MAAEFKGASDNDAQSFSEYLISLLDHHMDVPYCILKHLWRKINQLQLTHWNLVYLQLLSSVQEAMQETCNAPINTDFMHLSLAVKFIILCIVVW